MRTLDRLDVTRQGDTILITTSARSFLHHQVRNMAGTLKLVGDGTWHPARVEAALQARARAAAGPTAPAAGLVLTGVEYADDPFVKMLADGNGTASSLESEDGLRQPSQLSHTLQNGVLS